MKLLEKVHAIRAGVYKGGNGRIEYYSPAELKEIAEAYNPKLHSAPMQVAGLAPAVLGHNDPRAGSAMPSFGWILRAWAEGADMFLDVVIHDTLADWVEQKFYQKISMSFYRPSDPHNPVPGIRSIRHIGFLGAEPPVVKGLDPLPMSKPFNFLDKKAQTMTYKPLTPTEFAEGSTPGNLTEQMPDWLRFVIADGSKGYKGEITRFDPEPDESNGFLLNDEGTELAGGFVDESDPDDAQSYTFRVYKEGDTWSREYALKGEGGDAAEAIEASKNTGAAAAAEEDPEQAAEPAEPTELGEAYKMQSEEPDPDELMEKDYDKVELAEGNEAADSPNYEEMYLELRAQTDELEQKLADMIAEQEEAEFMEYCETAGISEDKRPGVVKLMRLINSMSPAEFSEGGMSPIDFFKSIASGSTTVAVDTGEIEYAETLGSDVSLHGKALAYCEQNGLNPNKNDEYIAAVKAVS